MTNVWTRHIWNYESLVRRIDRCYLVAAGRVAERRQVHLDRARYYRQLLGRFTEMPA